ncbi:hypothetical protein D3C79_765600 [compost metagenome]
MLAVLVEVVFLNGCVVLLLNPDNAFAIQALRDLFRAGRDGFDYPAVAVYATVVLDGLFTQDLVAVVLDPHHAIADRHVFISEVGADKALRLVCPGNAPDLAQRGQIDPAVCIFIGIGVLQREHPRAFHILGFDELQVGFARRLVAVVDAQLQGPFTHIAAGIGHGDEHVAAFGQAFARVFVEQHDLLAGVGLGKG